MGTERLSADDTRILKLESSSITGHTCKLILLEPREGEPIGIDDLRAHVQARLGRVRRCRQRVAFVPLGIARPAWVDDAAFDIRNHVRLQAAESPLDQAGLLRAAGRLMAQRLDHRRPLWQMDLVGPLEGGGSAIVWRIHHCMADGVSSARLGGQILWDPRADAEAPAPERWQPGPQPSAIKLLSAGLADRAGELGGSLASAAAAIASPRRWTAGVRAAARAPRALVRELSPLGSGSPFDSHIGLGRELAVARHPLEELRRIERAVGERIGAHVTINDVVLAAISGAIRRWLRHQARDGMELGRGHLRVQVPVSMHHRSERADALGNRDSFLFVDLPVEEPDPVRRVELINAETTVRKQAHDAETLYTFFHAASRLGPMGRELVRVASGPREFSLAVSNVPGPREPVYVLGRRVEGLYSIAEPADRHALRVSAISCAGTMHFGICTDPEALEGVGELAAGIDEAVSELRAAC